MKYLIAGLGNVGSEYANTRHNIGFKTLDALSGASSVSFEPGRYADVAQMKYRGRILVLIKPTTLMNLSGKAVNYWLQKEKIPLERLMVVTDDLALPFGKQRLRTKGSDGGHNGLKNINQILGSNSYPRLRMGVGDEFQKGSQVQYVLGEWSPEEEQKLPERLEVACDTIKAFTTVGAAKTMSIYNNK
jgi:PTH1 family peptidyl-tRNA hydrolase